MVDWFIQHKNVILYIHELIQCIKMTQKSACNCFHCVPYIYIYTYIYMGQVVEKRTIGAGQAKIIKLTITLNNFITLEEQLIPFI